jgi:putative ABC transport system permease protein
MGLIRFLSSLPWASGLVAGGIPPTVLTLGMLIAVLVGVLGAAYPAWRGAQLDPTEALRHE